MSEKSDDRIVAAILAAAKIRDEGSNNVRPNEDYVAVYREILTALAENRPRHKPTGVNRK